MDIDQARKYLKRYHKPEYARYIETTLAGDFAVVLAEDHERILRQLKIEEVNMKDKIIQVSGFGVDNTQFTQCNYMVVGVTMAGNVLLTRCDGVWEDISAKKPTLAPDSEGRAVLEKASIPGDEETFNNGHGW